MIVVTCLATLAACGLVAWTLDRRHAARMQQHADDERRILASVGLTVTTGPEGWRATRESRGLVIDSPRELPLPGSGRGGEEGPTRCRVTVVAFDDPRPDLFCASPEHVLECVGPVSAVPRQRTGDPAFDARFEVRSAAPLTLSPAVGTALARLGLAWIHRRDGRTHLALTAARVIDAPTLIDLADRLDERVDGYRGASPEGGLRPALGATVPVAPPHPLGPLQVTAGLGLFTSAFAAPLGMLFVGPFREFFAAAACAHGVPRMVSTSDGSSTSYGLVCPDGSAASDAVLLVAGLLWWTACCVLGTALSAKNALAARR